MIDYFWSDPHFGHANVIQYSSRPFGCVEEMNAILVDNYNAAVQPGDTCLWVGDCFLCSFDVAAGFMRRLNGRKILVLGNHDRSALRMSDLGFDVVTNALTLRIAGQPVRVSHLPYRGMDSREPKRSDDDKEKVGSLPTWERRGAAEWLLHGHTHSKKRQQGQAIHVGVDAWDYRPASIAEIEALMAPLPTAPEKG